MNLKKMKKKANVGKVDRKQSSIGIFFSEIHIFLHACARRSKSPSNNTRAVAWDGLESRVGVRLLL